MDGHGCNICNRGSYSQECIKWLEYESKNRNIDIQNANQQYVNNISSKYLQQQRENKQSNLDLAKLGILYGGLDKGTTGEIDKILGENVRNSSRKALTTLTTQKNGGLLAYKRR